MRRIVRYLVLLLGALVLASCSAGSGNTTNTVFVYLIGTDLESAGGAATTNIQQMLAVSRTDHLNIVLQTGGANRSTGPLGIDWTHVQRYLVQNGKLILIEDLGPDSAIDMGKASTLQDFLRWGVQEYPASRYLLVLWDHGSGPNGGIGSDEITNTAMPLAQLTTAVQAAGVSFDVIGFDACLMADSEVAAALAPYGKYFVASQDVEPGAGWDYTPWLTALEQQPGASGAQIGRNIVDAYMAQGLEAPTTLSLIDLQAMPALVQAMNDFAQAVQPYASSSVLAWQVLADSRLRTLAFASQNFLSYSPNLVPYDLVDQLLWTGQVENALLKSFGPDSALSAAATEVINATAAAVVYNRATSIDAQATGLSVYFPGMLATYPSTNYASNLLIDGQSVFAPSYVDALLPAYYDFYVNQQASLAASVSTAPVAGGSFAATVTNSFDFVMVAAGNPNCTVYVGSSSQQLPCEETMQQATDYTHNPGDPTWQFSFTLPGSWPMLQGAAVSLIPDPGVLTGASSLSYVIPCNLWNANDQEFIPGYLRVVMSDVGASTSYAVIGFEEALGAKGKTRALAPGDVLALDDYVQNSDGSWGFLRSDRTITLGSSSPQLSFGAYALVTASPLTYVVNDLTGTPRVGQVQTY